MIEQKFLMRPQEGFRNFLYFGLLDFIKSKLNKTMVGVEIGSYAGESSILISDNVKRLYCIDTWDTSHFPKLKDEQNTVELVEKIFDERINYAVNINKMKMTSEEASKKFEDESLDFVYIDGGHSTEDIQNDLHNWYQKIKAGGVISGHDYNCFEVSQVVNQYVRHLKKNCVEVFSDYTWSFIK